MRRFNYLSEFLTALLVLLVGAGLYAAEVPNTSVFSQTDASNNSGTVPTWAEGQAPSQVNDSARALQGAVTREWNWSHPTLSSTGSANAYVLTYSVAPAALYNGMRHCFEANFSNTGTATLNVNGLGAKTIQKVVAGTLTNLAANDIYAGSRPCVTYRSTGTVYVLENPGHTAAGDVSGPGSANDNRVARFDGTTGKLLQNSQVNIADAGTITQHGTDAEHQMYEGGADATGPRILVQKNRSTTDEFAFDIVQNGDDIFELQAYGADGVAFRQAAGLLMEVDGTPGSGDMPGRTSLCTTPDNTTTCLLRLRIENDHDIFAYKDDGANPGQVVAEHWIKLNADYTLTSSASAQQIFDTVTNGRITVDTGEYFYKCQLYVTTMSATSGNAAFLFGGGATLASGLMHVVGIDNSTPLVAGTTTQTAAQDVTSPASMVTATTGTGLFATIDGTFEVTVAGTLIPQITLVTAASAVVKKGSYCKINRAGGTGTDSIGAWD